MKWKLFLIINLAFLISGCGGPVDTCDTPSWSSIHVKVANHSSIPIKKLVAGYSTLQPGQAGVDRLYIGSSHSCGGPPIAPQPTDLDTAYVWLLKTTDTTNPGTVLYGGPLADYQEWVAKIPTSSLAKATLHAHSLFFVPGSQVRQDMGLVVNNPTGTEIFTSLDPWRPYKFEGFTLNIDVYDLDAGDIRMSVTGTLAN